MLKLGVNTNNQCGKDFDEILKNIKAAGFDSVMVSFDLKDDEGKIQKTINSGLEITCVHLDYQYGNDLWLEGASCDKYVENVIKQIELCAKYNIKKVVFHCTWGSPNDIANKPSKAGLKHFQKILNVIEKHNMIIAIENTDLDSLKHMAYLFKHFKSERLAFCFDVGHNHLYSPKEKLLRKFGRKLAVVHLHDNFGGWKRGFDFTKDAHLLPFDGEIDYTEVCEAIAASSIDTILLEIRKANLSVPKGFYDKFTPLQYLKEAYNRAKKLAAKVEGNKKL